MRPRSCSDSHLAHAAKGRIPFVATRQYKCSPDIVAFLKAQSASQGLVWASAIGGNTVSDDPAREAELGVHMLVELQAADAMHAVSVAETLKVRVQAYRALPGSCTAHSHC